MNKWDRYFINIANESSKNSTCIRRQVGAVIVKNNCIVSTGYNGAPSKVKHCTDRGGCLRQKLNIASGERHELCYGAHAEANAIFSSSKNGVSIDGSIIYCTTYPCSQCAKGIINSGIKEVKYIKNYEDKLSHTLFKEAGIICTRLQEVTNE